ncbi:MAG: 5-methylcytosine restriction system specificity protein McrC [Candidatus Scalindua sp.]
MAKSKQLIETKDCLSFDPKWNEQLRVFAEMNDSFSVFNICSKEKEMVPLITYNYQEKRWYASRYIGSIDFKDKKTEYTINIVPRFGDSILFTMFEELFNIKFSSGRSRFQSKSDSYYIKVLISFVWLQKLADANRHGIPQVKVIKTHEGYTVKGRLLVKPSLIPIHTSRKVVSSQKEKFFDEIVTRILNNAFLILKKRYYLGKLSIPENAREAIQQLNPGLTGRNNITYHDYKSVKYHPMYQRFQDVVDFSWQIIQSAVGLGNQSKNKKLGGFFLDMAEIWESYIRSIIIKKYIPLGWHSEKAIYSVYNDRFYKRKMIPDIVLKKNDNYIVFDAKYKRMHYSQGFTDVDRNDFFQIHTYISYLNERGNVLLGGLIYPVMSNPINEREISPELLFDTNRNTLFFADGPILDSKSINTESFFNRIAQGGKTGQKEFYYV